MNDGFNVAHEPELTKRQDRTNRALMLVAGVLALSALLGLMPSVFSFPIVAEQIVVGALVVSLVGVLALLAMEYTGRP